MARALMADPELVMLDEPMAGVNPALTQSLLGHVKALRDDGPHRAVRRARHGHGPRHLRLGDRDGPGQIIAEGPPDAVMGDQRVIDAYLGSHHDQDLSEEMEEKILAEAQAEIDAKHEEDSGPPRPRSQRADTDTVRPQPTSRPPRAPCCAPTT